MENDKFAVLIVGNQNSGKTATIKNFQKLHEDNNREILQCRFGWRRINLFFGKLDALSCLIYFIPSSPTEKNISLENLLKKIMPMDSLPELFLIAEQLDGKEYNSTKDFLEKMGYEIKELGINSDKTGGIWEFCSEIDKDKILTERATEIGNAFRNYIIKKII